MKITIERRKHGGSWRPPPEPVPHPCLLPQHMPGGVPEGLIFRCSVCDAEWTWRRQPFQAT